MERLLPTNNRSSRTSETAKRIEGVLLASCQMQTEAWNRKKIFSEKILNFFQKLHLIIVNLNNETLPFCSETKYLGVTLDKTLTYRRHLESLCKKMTSRVALLRRLAGSGWGAGATTLRTTTLALVHSTAMYCAPVWWRSEHTRLIDPPNNDALRVVTGCLRPTPSDNLVILTGT